MCMWFTTVTTHAITAIGNRWQGIFVPQHDFHPAQTHKPPAQLETSEGPVRKLHSRSSRGHCQVIEGRGGGAPGAVGSHGAVLQGDVQAAVLAAAHQADAAGDGCCGRLGGCSALGGRGGLVLDPQRLPARTRPTDDTRRDGMGGRALLQLHGPAAAALHEWAQFRSPPPNSRVVLWWTSFTPSTSGDVDDVGSNSGGGGGGGHLKVRSACTQWVCGARGWVVRVTGCSGQKRALNSTSNHTTTLRQATGPPRPSCAAPLPPTLTHFSPPFNRTAAARTRQQSQMPIGQKLCTAIASQPDELPA